MDLIEKYIYEDIKTEYNDYILSTRNKITSAIDDIQIVEDNVNHLKNSNKKK